MKETRKYKKPKEIMNIRIDENLKQKFRIKTIQEKTTMSEVITNYIENYLKD